MQSNQVEQPTTPKNPNSTSQFIKTIVWGVLIFILLFALAEGCTRLGWLDRLLPQRSLGDYHAQFEIKWFKLEDFVQKNGGVDVILLGNSMVNTGIDPEILAADYANLTGTHLRIFNFGVEGLTVEPVSVLAKILEEKYHPGTILLYTEIRDYAANNGVSTSEQFLSADWMQYKTGKPVFLGWLIDHSMFLQRLLPYRNWSRSDFFTTDATNLKRFSDTSVQGYEADKNIGENVDQAPNPSDPEQKSIFDLFKGFQVDPGRLSDLQNILDLQGSGTRVLVSEMPVYPTYYAYFSPTTVTQYHQNLAKFVANSGSKYLPALDYSLIPLEDRVDNHHLNFQGAPLFSQLLAQQLADLCRQEQQYCLQAAGGQSKP